MSDARETLWFPSKIDTWLLVVLVISSLMSLAAAIGTVIAGAGVLVATLSCGMLAAIYGGLVFPMRYGLSAEVLTIRHGLVRYHIPLSSILTVAPTRDLLAAPALSIDRIRIERTGANSLMISPDDCDRFCDELVKRTSLARNGDKLVRA